LCDEATSALDSTSEAEILRAFKSSANNRTSIFIAHRLTTAMHCDEVKGILDIEYVPLIELPISDGANRGKNLVPRIESVEKTCIIVLENGRVVQQGPHDVLLSKVAGRYAELWAQQNNAVDGVDGTIKMET
ncbi:unnamed protein product, partial [Ilex paraguariensis]